jgi:hypothetical protein
VILPVALGVEMVEMGDDVTWMISLAERKILSVEG